MTFYMGDPHLSDHHIRMICDGVDKRHKRRTHLPYPLTRGVFGDYPERRWFKSKRDSWTGRYWLLPSKTRKRRYMHTIQEKQGGSTE